MTLLWALFVLVYSVIGVYVAVLAVANNSGVRERRRRAKESGGEKAHNVVVVIVFLLVALFWPFIIAWFAAEVEAELNEEEA